MLIIEISSRWDSICPIDVPEFPAREVDRSGGLSLLAGPREFVVMSIGIRIFDGHSHKLRDMRIKGETRPAAPTEGLLFGWKEPPGEFVTPAAHYGVTVIMISLWKACELASET
ncbi:hypothetical protein [Nocardia nova]|uniref:hypothetical protein n=1 Tax=Nocardia nova TaxID=37330 RepID=UPI0033EE5AEB